jgi:hypothetical protein
VARTNTTSSASELSRYRNRRTAASPRAHTTARPLGNCATRRLAADPARAAASRRSRVSRRRLCKAQQFGDRRRTRPRTRNGYRNRGKALVRSPRSLRFLLANGAARRPGGPLMLRAPPAPSPSARERLRTAPGPRPCKHLAASGNAAALPGRAPREGRADVRSSAPPGRCSGLGGRRNSAAARPTGKGSEGSSWRLLAHVSDSTGALADRPKSGIRQAHCRLRPRHGVAPGFMLKRNSEPTGNGGPTGDDAAPSRLAKLGCLDSQAASPCLRVRAGIRGDASGVAACVRKQLPEGRRWTSKS